MDNLTPLKKGLAAIAAVRSSPAMHRRRFDLLSESPELSQGIWEAVQRFQGPSPAPFVVQGRFPVAWTTEPDFVAFSLFTTGRYKDEEGERVIFENAITPGATVLDIGAHHGFYSMLASSVAGPEGNVFAFEPSPKSIAALHRHNEWNQLIGNKAVTVVEAAASSKVGSEYLNCILPGGDDGMDSLRPVIGAASQAVMVQTINLSEYLAQNSVPHIDFIKLDAEGSELAILRTLRERIIQDAPDFLIELRRPNCEAFGYSVEELYDFLTLLGYDFYQAQPDASGCGWGLTPYPRESLGYHQTLFAIHRQ